MDEFADVITLLKLYAKWCHKQDAADIERELIPAGSFLGQIMATHGKREGTEVTYRIAADEMPDLRPYRIDAFLNGTPNREGLRDTHPQQYAAICAKFFYRAGGKVFTFQTPDYVLAQNLYPKLKPQQAADQFNRDLKTAYFNLAEFYRNEFLVTV